MGVLLLKEFIEEYDQNHLRTFMIPRNFSDKYWNTKLTYDEWMTLLNMYIPGEVPEDE